MEPEYIDFSLNSDDVMKGLSAIADKLLTKIQYTPVKKRGGLNEVTDLRQKTATMIGKSFAQVCGLTKGWTAPQLYEAYHSAEQFVNPGALWWIIYKKNKNIYGRTNKRAIQKMGKGRGKKDILVGQRTLFEDR